MEKSGIQGTIRRYKSNNWNNMKPKLQKKLFERHKEQTERRGWGEERNS